MKKNHFIMPYAGNKRKETLEIIKSIEDNYDLNQIDTIIEPFCGSSAISYALSLKYPKKFTYILNDNDEKLIELYKIFMNDESAFIQKINSMCDYLNGIEDEKIRKQEYVKIGKQQNVYSYFFIRIFYTIRPGLYPQRKLTHINKQFDICNFLKTEKIQISSIDGLELIQQHEHKKNVLMICDPPYLMSCNNFYDNLSQVKNNNIYMYVFHSVINANNIFILEDIWINDLLFKHAKYDIASIYAKNYEMSKKKTKHIIYYKKMSKIKF